MMSGKGKRLLGIALAAVMVFPTALISACSSGEDEDFAYVAEDLSSASSAELEALTDYEVFYKPDGGRVGDVMPYYEDGTYYLYYLRDGGGSSSHPAYLVTTTDFVHYTEYGEVLAAGSSTAADSMIGTGSVLRHDGKYLFFYTGHPASGAETLLLATSDNPTDFEKQTSFSVSPADYGFENDFRDPEVSFNEETGEFDCIVSTRKEGRAVLAYFRLSEDLTTVTYDSILYEDAHGFNVLECPTLFPMGGKWYLTYSAQDLSLSGNTGDVANDALTLTGNKGSMYYLVSENRFGPFREFEDPMLDSTVFYAGKVAEGNETMLVGWAAERSSNLGYEYAWGGNLVAHTLTQNTDGTLALSYPDAYAEHFDLRLPLRAEEDTLTFVASEGSFQDIADEVLEYRLTMNVSFTEDTQSFGLVFGLLSDMESVVKVTLDPVSGKIKAQYGSNAEMASRYIALEAETTYRLDVFAEGSNFVLYVNGTPFTFKVRNSGNKKIAAFANGGIVTMSDMAMFAPSGEDFNGAMQLAAGESKTFSLCADTASYLSGYASLYASHDVTVDILSGETVLESASGAGHLDLYAYAKAEAGDGLTVRVTAQTAATVRGAVNTMQSYYIPVRARLCSDTGTDRGATVTVGEGQDGYVFFSAVAAQLSAGEGRLVLTKNGEEVASVLLAGGFARIGGAVYAEAGDVLSASIDYDGAATSYSCSLNVYSGAAAESCLAVSCSDRPYEHDLGVEIASGRTDNAKVQTSFGEQGTDGFVYTYGKAIDEMKALTTFNTNAEETFNYKYTQTSVASDIEVKADWMKTGSGYMTGVTYVAAQTGTIQVSLRVKPTEASGGYILVQLFQNRFRLAEAIVGADWDWQTYNVTVSVQAGDQIIFGMKNIGYYTDTGAAAANYAFEISAQGETSKIADFREDFSLENNPSNNWQYGWVNYAWNTDLAIKNTQINESFTFEKATQTSADAWLPNGMEIKSDWINSGGNAAIAYTFENGGYTKIKIGLNGSQEGSRLAIRYAVIGSDGVVRAWEFYNAEAKEWSLDRDVNVYAGDTLYIMFFNETKQEGSYPQAYFSIVLEQ